MVIVLNKKSEKLLNQDIGWMARQLHIIYNMCYNDWKGNLFFLSAKNFIWTF